MFQRILIAAGYLGNWGETDGVVTTYRNLIPRFEQAGIAADILSYGPSDKIERHGSVTLITHKPRIPVRIDPTRWIDLAIAFSETADLIRQNRYDLVQSSTPDPAGLFALNIARKQQCPMVMIYHTALDHYAQIRYSRKIGAPIGKMMGSIMSQYINWYYNKCDLILAPSRDTMEELRPKFKPEVAVLSRGVNTEKFNPSYRTRTDSRVKALYVGRVAPEKNLPILVDMFKNRSDVDLVVVGDGPYLQEMKAALPKAEFLGKIIGEQLANAYANGDFFVFPSRTDTLGNCVLEAMSSGLPVIVSDAMGPKELVKQGETGFITTSEADFSRAVDLLVTDSERRKRMGNAALASAKLRSWDEIFHQLTGYYDSLTHKQATPVQV